MASDTFGLRSDSELYRRRWRALTVTSVGAFMTPLDASIVSVALPAIGPSLSLTYSEALWVQASYLLLLSVCLIPSGRLADERGLLRLYMLGVGVFAVASIASSLAFEATFLIVSRCAQGIGAALLAATSVAIVTAAFPPNERGRAVGVNVMAVYIGLTAGPPLGGLIVSTLGWRWIFLINVPIALVTLLSGWDLIAVEKRDRLQGLRGGELAGDSLRPAAKIDIPGSILLGLTLAFLFVPLTFSPFWGYANPLTLAMLATAGVLLVTFILVERRVRQPLLDLDLLRKNRLFAAANGAALLNYAAMYGVTILTAVYLEVARGDSPEKAGLILLAQPVVQASLSPISGRLSDRLGSRLLATAGMLIVAAGMVDLALLSTAAPTWHVVVALVIVGLGMATFSAPNTSAVMGSVPRSRLSLASGFLGTMRATGQGISIAVLGAIAASKLGPAGGRVLFLGAEASSSASAAFAHGYSQAMLVGAAMAIVGAGISLVRGPVQR